MSVLYFVTTAPKKNARNRNLSRPTAFDVKRSRVIVTAANEYEIVRTCCCYKTSFSLLSVGTNRLIFIWPHWLAQAHFSRSCKLLSMFWLTSKTNPTVANKKQNKKISAILCNLFAFLACSGYFHLIRPGSAKLEILTGGNSANRVLLDAFCILTH